MIILVECSARASYLAQLKAIKQLKTHENWTMPITQSINIFAISHKNWPSLEIQYKS